MGRVRGWGSRFAVGAACVLAVCGCGGGEDTDPSGSGVDKSHGALAQVNRAELNEDELRTLIPSEIREGITGAEIRDILDRWVETELLYQKARQEGVDRDPEVAKLLYDMERQLLADEYLQRELKNRVFVDNDEIQAYYDANKDKYTRELHLRHIVLDTLEDAQEVLAQLENGASFDKLARQRSVDASSSKGGDLGYLSKGSMNPAFESFAFSMEKNELVGPVPSTFGFHVVKLVGRRRSAQPVSFEDARDEIMQELLLEKQQQAHAEILSELRGAATVHTATSYAGMPLEAEDASPEAPAVEDDSTKDETQGTH